MQGDLDLDTDEQRPIKQSFCGSLRRDAHWKCLILTLLIAGCLSAIAWCRLAVLRRPSSSSTSSSFTSPAASQPYYTIQGSSRFDPDAQRDSPCDDGYVYIPVAFVIMLYLVYLVECWHSHTRIELQYKVDINTVYDKVRDMRDGVPIIWWKAICYHYVRRTRQVTRYRNGDAFTSTQVYYERVNTCTAGSAFNFTQCGVKDISRTLRGLEDYPATKIRFSKGFSFASVESECEFEDQRAQFFQEYEARDDYMEGREGMDILNVNFKEYMIAFTDPDNLPWYVSHAIFWIASFLLLSWPLRVIIEYKTAHLHYHVHKLFGTNYVDAELYRGTMSRVSTMNSNELEMNIRNNNFMVPSYSDALLMNAARRASLAATTRAGGGSRCLYGSTTPRSLTNPALCSSRSGTFVLGSLPSIPMTTVRRFHSCTAINNGDKLPVDHSGLSIFANGGVTTNDETALLAEENSANLRSDRRRWRRKRPMSSITFSGSVVGTMLPTTPETPEGYVIELDATTGSAIVTHFHAEDCGATTITNNGAIRNERGSVPTQRSARPGTPGSRPRIPFGGSSQSMTLSETPSGNLSSTTSEGELPPAYNEALTMPRFHIGEPQNGRLQRSISNGQRLANGGEGNRGRQASQQSGESSIPSLPHSESLRLFRTGSPTYRFFRSNSQRLVRNQSLENGLRRSASGRRLTRSESQGFSDRAAGSESGPAIHSQSFRRGRDPGGRSLPGSNVPRLSASDNTSVISSRSHGSQTAARSLSADGRPYQQNDNQIPLRNLAGNGPAFGEASFQTLRQTRVQYQRNSGERFQTQLINGNADDNLQHTSAARGPDFRPGSPVVISPAVTRDLEGPSESKGSRARASIPRFPRQLPAVALHTICPVEDDDPESADTLGRLSDDDYSPLEASQASGIIERNRARNGQVLDLDRSSSEVSGVGERTGRTNDPVAVDLDISPQASEVLDRRVRQNDRDVGLDISTPQSDAVDRRNRRHAELDLEISSSSSATAQMRGGVQEGDLDLENSVANSASAAQSAVAGSRIISPSTAQRCYRSIDCMETSL